MSIKIDSVASSTETIVSFTETLCIVIEVYAP